MKRLLTSLAVALAGLMPLQSWACASCFGQSDSALAKGLNAGIFALLIFVVGFWVLFGSFFVYLVRRAKQVDPDLPGDQHDSQHN